MQPLDVRKLGEQLIGIAKQQIEDGHNVTPVMAFFKIGERPHIVPIPNDMMEDSMKDHLAAIMKHSAKALNADFFLFLSDTWVAFTEDMDKDDFLARRQAFGGVSGMPEKEDALILCIESKTAQSMTTIRYKKTGRKVEYKPESVMEGAGTGTTGRFSNIIYSPQSQS